MMKRLGTRIVPVLWLTSMAAPAAVFVAAGPAEAQTGYLVEDLGTLKGDTGSVAWAINANGDTVGWSNGPNGTRAFLYTANGIVALPSLPGRPRTVARDINDDGDIVGSANAGGTDLGHAVLWSRGSVQDLGTLGTGFYSEAWGINNLGQVVGWSYTNGGNGLTGVHGFVFSEKEGLIDLTPASDRGLALDVNDAGQVTGYKTAVGGYHAFRWEGGTFLDLGVLPGMAHSVGWAINAFGQVAGNSTSASGNSERFVRYIEKAGLQNLGGTGEHNVALGINESGQVVGMKGSSLKRAVLYTDEAGLQDLNALIDPSLGWVLLAANDINDKGQIVGYALNNHTGRTHAVRLQPTDTPPEACTLQCLRSTSITLRVVWRPSATIKGRVTVQDENGASVPGALVVGAWTRPDGTTDTEYSWTDANGLATFTGAQATPGTYTLTIVNILLSQHTFDPIHSVLAKSITVRR